MSELLTEGDLAELRAIAESSMWSRARVRRRNGTTTVGGLKVPAWADVLAETPFKLGDSTGGRGATRTVTIGSTEVEMATRTGKFPALTEGLQDGDIVEVIEGEHAGVFVQVVESTGVDQQVALRVPVVEIQQPEGWT